MRGLRRDLAVVVVLGVAAFLLAGQLSQYNQTLGTTFFFYAASAQAWNLLGGYGGQFSLGHQMFVGVGAYATAVVLIHRGWNLWLSMLIAALACAVFAAIIAVPLLRLRNVYFSVGTLGVALATLAWMTNWKYTGQTSGLSLPFDALPGFKEQYYMGAGLLVATTLVVVLIVHSRFGMRLQAVRDDEDAAAELGVNGFATKIIAFTISAFFVGLAGALFSVQQATLDPNTAFSMNFTVNMVIMTVIGGLATVPGPIVGAAIVYYLQQKLQAHTGWNTLITGVVLIGIIRVAPGGVWGVLASIPARLADLRSRGGTPAAPERAA